MMEKETTITEEERQGPWLSWGTVEIDGAYVEIEDNLVDVHRGGYRGELRPYYLKLRWPDGSRVLLEMEGELEPWDQSTEASGAAKFCDDMYDRAWEDPVVVHRHTTWGIQTERWPRPKEGAWKKTLLGKMIAEYMHAAGIESLEALGEMLGEAPYDKYPFDAEFIERATWDHWHGVPSLFWHRLQEALGLDEQQGRELCWAWAMTENDEEGHAGRGALLRPCPPVRPR